ncbi:TRI15 protein [Verticillium dahliae VdLs.17]|uniref:TRI15 protein n=1 Tax=Verticillium dahliae (strain VdLs.17 / ATCC MYA-4575 / FGSC 10137) TaxID=498257 RepID=G2XGW7_VERDV|nr:TRI15 protein [Verticillium dahliae VdLs.17]EGY19065.1 TRI15 protein [Verticillium dahliae VdLs.17]
MASNAIRQPQALTSCRLCDLSFSNVAEKRQHAKSDWHIYKIRCRVAEEGTLMAPPESAGRPSTRRGTAERAAPISAASACAEMQDQDTTDDEDDDDDDANDSPSEANPNIVKFIPSACLFCPKTSRDFEANLLHMHQAHSLAIPFRSSLAVDPQTLLWFLHMTIFSYRECICCGTRRRTVVAVQQHMRAAGHCRFSVTPEMNELYDLDSLARRASALDVRGGDTAAGRGRPVRGLLCWLRRHMLREALSAGRDGAEPVLALARRDRREQALAAGMARLRAADRMSVVHLPLGQQRALLVARTKELDGAKRAEWRTRGRRDHVGNVTAIHTNCYKQEVPVYMSG